MIEVPKPAPHATGEARLKARKRAQWVLAGAGIIGGLVAGMALGLTGELGRHGLVNPLVVWPVLVLTLVGFTYYSWLWFRRIDELDLADNLWAGLIGFYFYFMGMPAWWAMAYIGQVPPYDEWAMWLASAAVMAGAYGGRKLRQFF